MKRIRILSGLVSSGTLRWILLPASAFAAGFLMNACGAPASRPAQGAIADEVRRSIETGTQTFDHSAWDRLLKEGTDNGLVNYPYFQKNRDQLDDYLKKVASSDLESLTKGALMALLINAYNAYTVQSILDHPEVSSIQNIDGVWTKTTHPVGGHEVTLDEIEHNLLRPFFTDPRIHFGVNCASRSCAPLPAWAFNGESVDTQLEQRTRDFLSDPNNVRVEGDKLLVSKYFDWYGEDFSAEGWRPRAENFQLFIAGYTRPDVKEFIESKSGDPATTFLPYDWSLNASQPPDPAQTPPRRSGE